MNEWRLLRIFSSDYQNYFWCAGQNVRQMFSPLPDILPHDNVQQPLVSLLVIFFILTTAGQHVRQCLNSLPDISKSCMCGIFDNHYFSVN